MTFFSKIHSLDPNGVFIVAEIGKNFIQTEDERPVSEYLKNAKALVDAAKDSGADAVKFQTHEIEDEHLDIATFSPHFTARDRYQWIARNAAATPLEEFWMPLKKHCSEKGIIFFSTPMSRKAAQKLHALDVPLWKIGSGDVLDFLMLNFMLNTGKPVIVSSGMVSLEELDRVVRRIAEKAPLAILYCVSRYPAPPEYFNLGTIEYLKEKYPHAVIGFSDHSLGFEIALSAVKLGARIIEKHFSFSRGLWGPDHKVSMTPDEMKSMVSAIRSGAYRDRNAAKFYGKKEREFEGASNIFRPYFHKSLMAGCDMPPGTVVRENMIFAMRPKTHANGHPSDRVDDILGKKIKHLLKKYDPIMLDSLDP